MCCLRGLSSVGVLLALLLAAALGDTEVSLCPDSGLEEAGELTYALRQTACDLNITASQQFHRQIRAKHGAEDARGFFASGRFFQHFPIKVWCRRSCPNVAAENITWCVNIANFDHDIETCISPSSVNSSCEAELVGLENFLSLPADCAIAGGVGCLGLTNIDWYFKNAYLTCTVHTDTCYEKSFTFLHALPSTVTEPVIDVFPKSPVKVIPGNTMVLHAEATSTTDRSHAIWRHGNTSYVQYIREDPFCNPDVENCPIDRHPNATNLRRQRVRMYYTARLVQLTGCQNPILYRIESYLIINNTNARDGGEYVFNITSRYSTGSETVERKVTTLVECQDTPPSVVSCDHNDSISLSKGQNVEWSCDVTAAPNTVVTWVLGKSSLQHAALKKPCGKVVSKSYSVEERVDHSCYSTYTVSVQICAADSSVGGDYVVVVGRGEGGEGEEVEGTQVSVKMDPLEYSLSGEEAGAAAYSVPLAVLVLILLLLLAVLLVLLRMRKRRRRRQALVQSPIIKDISFMKKESELGLMSPLSPYREDASPQDPLEFPRNRLYIFTNKVLGEGSFGRVMQAKAESIVAGMPERNIVAVKTTKDNATSVEREELLAELELMRSMEPHENILNLLGQCTSAGGPVCLIVEYASYGNLRDFLRQCEEVVLSLNHLPHIRNRSRTRTFSTSSYGSTHPLMIRQDSVFTPSSGQSHFVFPSPPAEPGSNGSDGEAKHSAQHPGTATPLAHSVAPIGHDYINTKGLVYMEDVHNFALQIACGLQHLASMQIVHCDLAARNVLIAEGFVLKIADFGLARNISGSDFYKKNPRGKIPVKWTAPEALERRVFTTKSDIWSYGVVLWELFTYGHTPYPEVQLGPSYEPFIAYLKEGNRMAQPESCPPNFYELMLQCWHLNPDLRPTPHDIVAQLTPSDSIFDDVDSEVNGGHQVAPE